MAIDHRSVKPVSRKVGRSATAAAAYRAAEKVYDEMTGRTFDYTRTTGVERSTLDVEHRYIPHAAALSH